jgi:hypothetical protein
MIERYLNELIEQAMLLQKANNIDERLTGIEYKQNLIQNITNKINKIKHNILTIYSKKCLLLIINTNYKQEAIFVYKCMYIFIYLLYFLFCFKG